MAYFSQWDEDRQQYDIWHDDTIVATLTDNFDGVALILKALGALDDMEKMRWRLHEASGLLDRCCHDVRKLSGMS